MESLSLSDWVVLVSAGVQATATTVLVIVTVVYAYATNKIARANQQMATSNQAMVSASNSMLDEARRQRQDQLMPVIVLCQEPFLGVSVRLSDVASSAHSLVISLENIGLGPSPSVRPRLVSNWMEVSPSPYMDFLLAPGQRVAHLQFGGYVLKVLENGEITAPECSLEVAYNDVYQREFKTIVRIRFDVRIDEAGELEVTANAGQPLVRMPGTW